MEGQERPAAAEKSARASWPNEPRWDYALVHDSHGLIAVEVHPATAGEAKLVVAKQAWGRKRLAEAGAKVRQWWWIPSGKSAIPATGAARRQLARAGIRLSRRVLDETQVESE